MKQKELVDIADADLTEVHLVQQDTLLNTLVMYLNHLVWKVA